MSNTDLQHYYAKYSKSVLLAEGFTEFKGLSFIIKACRLKAINHFFEKRDNNNLKLDWFDEFGNTLHIRKTKKIKIFYGNTDININKIISTDFYYGLSLAKVVKMSNLAFIMTGVDDDFHEDFFLITLLGMDSYLRSYLYMYGDLQQVSPLIIGMQNLQMIYNNQNIRLFKRVRGEPFVPCQKHKSWLTSLPVHNGLKKLINNSIVQYL